MHSYVCVHVCVCAHACVHFLFVPFTYFILLGISAFCLTESYNFPPRRLYSASMVRCTFRSFLMRAMDTVQLLTLLCAKPSICLPPSLETLANAKQQIMCLSGRSRLSRKLRKTSCLCLQTQTKRHQISQSKPERCMYT